jgi:hypothetical protein
MLFSIMCRLMNPEIQSPQPHSVLISAGILQWI